MSKALESIATRCDARLFQKGNPSQLYAKLIFWMELFIVLAVALSYMTRFCTGTDVCSPSNLFGNDDMGLKNKDGALQFPVFHWKHPCLEQLHSASIASAEASPVVARDEIHQGKFLMVIGLGTPTVFNLVSIDTGSTLSWVQCQPCQNWCKSSAADVGPTFDPRNSTTYQRVACTSRDCAGVHELLGIPSGCAEETNTCLYSLRYGSDQYSVGKLGKDRLRLTLAAPDVVNDFVFGCGDLDNFVGREAGVIGLGNDRLSFINQVAAARQTNAFSYCFPGDHDARGFLSIGPYARTDGLEFTNLAFGYGGRDGKTFVYSIQQIDMTVDGRRLDVDPWVYTSQMMAVDSGSELTVLLAPVFDALDKAMTAAMAAKGYARQQLTIGDDVCYRRVTSSATDTEMVDWTDLLAVEMRFTGGTTLKLPPQNVFDQRLVDSERLLCLPFQPRDAGVNGVQILGNKVTRSLRLVFDLHARMIGFQPNAC